MSKPPIRVLVVDDSAFVRGLLARIIDGQPDMQCVGTAPDPVEAREMIRTLNPDVLTLDVEMPRMDGLEFLSRLMRLRPMPVVMVSTLTERGADVTLKALALGAIDFVAKPRVAGAAGMMDAGRELAEKIRVAAQARVQRLSDDAHQAATAPTPRRAPPAASAPTAARAAGGAAGAGASTPRKRALPSAAVAALSGEADAGAAAPAVPATPAGARGAERILFIGASTGGTEATLRVLMGLPADGPAVLISQHMPPGFTTSYAARLDSLCALRVKEAVDGDRVMAGCAYVAPGGRHLAIERVGSGYVTRVTDDEPVNLHRPSVEVLFRSAARHVGRNALGVMLTGMGGDGARAMREMRDAGSWNICQDEATCVVFGMPREAIAQGAAQEVLPLPRIAARVMEKFRGSASPTSAPAAGAAGRVAADH